MNEFSALRARARERRDAAIKQASTEYAESLNQIATLEDRLLQQARPKFRRVTDCIARGDSQATSRSYRRRYGSARSDGPRA
jgi:hypothetical protein